MSVILSIYKTFERVVIVVLLFLMMLVVGLAVIRMVVTTGQALAAAEPILDRVTPDRLHDIFGAFLMVLIGLELLSTVLMYLREGTVHVEVVFLVAMIAVARHLIVMDPEHSSPEQILSTAVAVVALTAGYFLLKKALPSAAAPKT